MLNIVKITREKELNEIVTRNKFVDFLFTHLGQFGDAKEAIDKSIDYAFSSDAGKGGFLLCAFLGEELVGALIMNKTGMEGYIPENVLVYVAVNSSHRNKGIGKKVIERSFELADGDIKLHVEYDNPAKRLYERLGMKNKYAEMRYQN